MLGPAARERQPREAAARAAEERQHARSYAGCETIEARALGEECPEAKSRAHSCGRQMPFELSLAPVPHQFRQRNTHRADFFATSAKRRGVRQVAGFINTDEA